MARVAAVLAVLLLATTLAAADSTNWLIRMVPSAEGCGSMGEFLIGSFTDYTDGEDTDPSLIAGTEGDASPTPPMPYVGLESTAFIGNLDLKSPITGTETKVWTLSAYTGNEATGPVTINIYPGYYGIYEYEPVYNFWGADYAYTFEGNMVPGGIQTFTASNPMPYFFSYIANPSDILTVTVAPYSGFGPDGPGFGPGPEQPDYFVPEEPESPDAPLADAGTIAYAKINGGEQTLAGKIVTAVFYQSDAQTVDFFYIEESNRSSGIMVQPPTGLELTPGYEVTVSGTVNGGTECYIAADSVTVTGTQAVCVSLGMPGWVTAGGEFGLQSALYLSSVSGQSKVGTGLNAVGMHVKVWGKVTSTGTEGGKPFYYIDDGSGLKRGTQSGLKVVYWYGCTPPSISVGDYCSFTGILGAELSEDATPLPVPIVRVGFRDVIYVKPAASGGNDSNSGLSWGEAKATVQNAIDTAYGMSSKPEVWVAAGTYGPITLTTDIALYGGFAGTETYLTQRNWSINETILDGNHASTVVTVDSSSSPIIDGFIIQNGYNANGGGIYCRSGTEPTIRNNIIGWNSGAGVFSEGSGLVIVNNIICNNDAGGYTGGIWCYSGYATIVNNTIVQNRDGGIATSPDGASVSNNIVAFNNSLGINGVPWAPPSLSHNCVYGHTYNYLNISQGATDITSDPKLANLAEGNLHIQPDSPCVDSGNDSAAEGIALDMDVQRRFLDIAGVGTSIVDIGADESDGSAWYYLALTANPGSGLAGEELPVTATVSGGLSLENFTVHFSVTGGTLTEVNGTSLPPGTISCDGLTNGLGQAFVKVTRATAGSATLSAAATRGTDETPETSLVLWWFDSIADDWPMFMHDPQHTGASLAGESSTTENFVLAWSTPTSGVDEVQTASTIRDESWSYHNQPGGPTAGYIFEHPYIDSSPVVMGNTVVVGTWTRGTNYFNATGSVKAFNGETGARLWTAMGNPAMGGVASTPCIWDGKVYVGTTNGYLYCLDLATGNQLWAQPTYNRSTPNSYSKIIASPVVHDGIVYIGNEAAKVYAFDADTGALETGYPIILPIEDHGITALETKNMTGISSPAIATVSSVDYLLFGCDDGYLYRLRLSDRQLNSVNLTYCIESSPTVVGNDVYVGISRYQGTEVYHLSIEPFSILYFNGIGEECRATLAYGFGHLYVGVDTGHTFHKLDPITLSNAVGTTFGDVNNPGNPAPYYFVGSAAIQTGGVVYVGNDNGSFYALLATNLSQVVAPGYNSGGIICSSPAIAYNVDSNHSRWVYVTTRESNGKLLAFKTVR